MVDLGTHSTTRDRHDGMPPLADEMPSPRSAFLDDRDHASGRSTVGRSRSGSQASRTPHSKDRIVPSTSTFTPVTVLPWYQQHRRRRTFIGFIAVLVAATLHETLVSTPLPVPQRLRPPLDPNVRNAVPEPAVATSDSLVRVDEEPPRTVADEESSGADEEPIRLAPVDPLASSSVKDAPAATEPHVPTGDEEPPTGDEEPLVDEEPIRLTPVAEPIDSSSSAPDETVDDASAWEQQSQPVETEPLTVDVSTAPAAWVTTDWTETRLFDAPDYTPYRALEDFLTGPALTEPHLEQATCQFRPIQYADHFPHAMQQLYRCFSWWIAHPEVPSVLWIPNATIQWGQNTSFIQGYIDLLQASFNLTVVYGCDDDSGIDCDVWVQSKDTGKWAHDTAITDFAMLDPNRLLRLFALEHLGDRTLHPAPADAATTCADPEAVPRISILDRPEWSSRHLQNGPALQAMMEARFHTTVPIVPFTYDTSFAEQATLFLDTDILIAPHGAQLTGMALLPKCASILEIFPYHYQAAEYFGSLAASLNLHHGFVYIGDPAEEIPHEDRFHFLRNENSHKDHSVEPNVTKINDALDVMLDHWKRCVCADAAAKVIHPTSDYIETNMRTALDYPTYDELSDFLQGPGLEDDVELTEAICEFRPVMYSHHFPHTMQQFYRCFSWWLAHPDLPAILVTGNGTDWGAETSFTQGFVNLLRSAINLTVVDMYDADDQMVQSKNTGKWEHDTEITDYAILDPTHQLHEHAVEYIDDTWNFHPPDVDWSQSDACRADAAQQDQEGFVPRISILDRPDWSTRHLKNGEELQDAIETMFNETVPLVTFSYYTTFEEQMALFKTADILISPHGAQLTGLAFLPRCASILEICPYRYMVPEYFGSLATSLQLGHGYVYLGDLDEVPDEHRYHFMRDEYNRKDWALEPNVSKITDALPGLIAKWRTCMCSAPADI